MEEKIRKSNGSVGSTTASAQVKPESRLHAERAAQSNPGNCGHNNWKFETWTPPILDYFQDWQREEEEKLERLEPVDNSRRF